MIIEKQLKTQHSQLNTFPEWCALYVKSRHEKKVAEAFEKYKIPYYLPLVKNLKIWSDRKKWVEEPLFRGYIFVPKQEAKKESIFTIQGLVAFVMYDGKKAVIKREELHAIQTFIEKGYHIESYSDIEFDTGDMVEILSGPFKGATGIIDKQDNNKPSYYIHFQTLGQVIRASLPKEVMRKVE